MENLKKLIIVIVILIIIITITLLVVGQADKNYKKENFENTFTMEVTNTIEFVKDRNEFFAVKSCVTKYITYIAQKDAEMLYSFLDKNYIEQYNVTEKNILSNLEEYEEPTFWADKMYVIQDTTEIYTYFVYGKVIDKQTAKTSDLNVVVRLDKQKDLFSIIPFKFVEDNNYSIEVGNNITLKYNDLPNNKYNKFSFRNITDEDMVLFYIDDIKDRMVYDVESSYNKLNKTYAENKYTSINKYKDYINKNITTIYQAKIQKYQINEYDKYKQYVCIDQNENYYIINEINPGQYELILDTYTIDIPQYVEKYNKASNQEKVALCIDKFMKNVNAENYTLAYSMLSSGFKNNYFKTLNSFEDYAKEHLLGTTVTFKTVRSEGDIYICEVTLTKEGINSQDRNFNVKLSQGTNFELSFNMD